MRGREGAGSRSGRRRGHLPGTGSAPGPGTAFSGNTTAGPGSRERRGPGPPAGREGATWRRSLREWQQSHQQRGRGGGAAAAAPELCPPRSETARPGPALPLRSRQTRDTPDRPEQDKTWLGKRGRFTESCVLGWSPCRNSSPSVSPGQRGAGPALQSSPELAALCPTATPPSHSLRARQGLPALLGGEQTGVLGRKTGFGIAILPPAGQRCTRSQSCCAAPTWAPVPRQWGVRLNPACLSSCATPNLRKQRKMWNLLKINVLNCSKCLDN